jgi:rhamnogalacturonan endolyase
MRHLRAALVCACLVATAIAAPRQMERLGRGVVAVKQPDGRVFVGWRLLATDRGDIGFNVYRSRVGGDPLRLNAEPITAGTMLVAGAPADNAEYSYAVRPVVNGEEDDVSAGFTLAGDAPSAPYVSIPLKTPDGTRPNDASVGDLDGDGEYEIVLHQAPRGQDNSRPGVTEPPILEAYKLDGTMLWRINLGINIREGAHYTQFMVYDLDGDGHAEVACKTADGTVDGVGNVIGDADADYREDNGYILSGPEYLTVFDGLTGAALATTDYDPPRGVVADWGDDYGNRVDRFLACVAYLDGERPSLVMCRGYYTRTVLAAWNWRDGELSHVWTFDSADGTPGNEAYAGQGNHGLSVGDVDGDGRDEIVYGASVIDDDGTGLYSTGLGHGDAMHLSDLDPSRPGLELFDIHEKPRHEHGIELRDAGTGEILWSKPSADVGRGMSMDLDPRYAGYESWASGRGLGSIYGVTGEAISDVKPSSCNMGVWWDGDTLRELLDHTTVSKWNWLDATETTLLAAADYGCVSNNGTKGNPCLVADILGDWREEIIWGTEDNSELRIFTSTEPTDRRFVTLMHDPVYRLSVAWQNVAYNQPTQVGFYMGADMPTPPRPEVRLAP